jgi:choline-sulfatase
VITTSRSLAVSFLIALAWLLTPPAHATEGERPNVLWICADDHSAYVCGAYGNKVVRTPHIDALAAGGIRFDRAYCNSPVCTASRQSFLTGRYPRSIGVTQLATALPESEITLAELLRDAGYDTAAIGKMHFNSELKHGFKTRIDLPDHHRWLQAKGKTPVPTDIEALPPWKPFRDPAAIWLNSSAKPFALADADMPGTYFADQAAEFLQRHSAAPGEGDGKTQRPFFLMVSFYEPHSPFHFPVEYRGRHKPGEFAAPAVGPEDDDQIPAIFRDLTPEEKRGIAAAYYTSVEFLDSNVGRVLAALEHSGQAQNTMVIYTGDHGYMLGQHGRFEKHCSFEPAVRAPLIMRFPGTIYPGDSTSALVEFIDIAPTVLEYCGVERPEAMQGRSLAPVLEKKSQRHRDEVFIEYSENEEAAIRTDRWKFVYTTGKRERQDGYTTGRPLAGRTIRLFDLEDDPDEMTNVADRPGNAPLVATFVQKLTEHLRRTAWKPIETSPSDDVDAQIDDLLKPYDVRGK